MIAHTIPKICNKTYSLRSSVHYSQFAPWIILPVKSIKRNSFDWARKKQVHLPTYANNVALPAFTRRAPLLLSAGHAAIDRYLLPAELTAANLQQRVCCCEPMLEQTDGRTPYHYIDPAPHSMRAVFKIECFGDTETINVIRKLTPDWWHCCPHIELLDQPLL